MTTYLLITSDKPTELTASTDGNYWLPVVNAQPVTDSFFITTEAGTQAMEVRLKPDEVAPLEGWEPEIVYQQLTSSLGWKNVDRDNYYRLHSQNSRQAYRLKRSEPVKELPEECQDPIASIGGCVFGGSSKNYCKKCVNESPIEAKTQEIDHDGKLGLPWFLQPYTDRYTNIIRSVKNPGMIVASCSMSRTQAEFIVEQCNKLYESHKTQESQSTDDTETPFQKEIHRDLIVFLPLMTKGEMKPEFNLGYVSIVDGKRVDIKLTISVS